MKFINEREEFIQIPAAFLEDYICDAPPEYVKVYLFGLYLAQRSLSIEPFDLEDRLHLSKDRIDSAFNYWSKKGFVELNGDSVSFTVPNKKTPANKTYGYLEAYEGRGEADPPNEILYEKSDYNKILNKLLKRQLTHSQLQKIYDFTDVFKLPETVVISMIEHCVTVKGADVGIAYLDKVAKTWADKGVSTLEQAQAQIEEYNAATGGAKRIMKRMGIAGKLPGYAELEYFDKWTKEWGFKPDAVLYAMKDTEFASITQPFKYLDEILRSLKEKGVFTSSQMYDLSEREKREKDEIKEIATALNSGRAANIRDYRLYYDKWRKDGIDHSIVIEACRECVKKGAPKPQAVDVLLKNWKKAGLNTAEQLSAHLKRRRSAEEILERVYNRAGITKQIGDSDIRLFETLIGKYQMTAETLFFAAEISADRAEDPYSYFKKILRVWTEKGIKTLDEAKKHDSGLKISAKPLSKPGFAQREFDEKAEKQRRVMEMFKEGERIDAQQNNS